MIEFLILLGAIAGIGLSNRSYDRANRRLPSTS